MQKGSTLRPKKIRKCVLRTRGNYSVQITCNSCGHIGAEYCFESESPPFCRGTGQRRASIPESVVIGVSANADGVRFRTLVSVYDPIQDNHLN